MYSRTIGFVWSVMVHRLVFFQKELFAVVPQSQSQPDELLKY